MFSKKVRDRIVRDGNFRRHKSLPKDIVSADNATSLSVRLVIGDKLIERMIQVRIDGLASTEEEMLRYWSVVSGEISLRETLFCPDATFIPQNETEVHALHASISNNRANSFTTFA